MWYKPPRRIFLSNFLAEHLLVTTRWIESQQQVGLPYLRLGSINRYSITEVEAWLSERYGRGWLVPHNLSTMKAGVGTGASDRSALDEVDAFGALRCLWAVAHGS